MSEEILNVLQGDSTTREIVKFCETPRTTDEIVKRLGVYYKEIRDSSKPEYDLRNRAGTRLRKLEKIKAVTYDKEKRVWKSELLALELLSKFFGM